MHLLDGASVHRDPAIPVSSPPWSLGPILPELVQHCRADLPLEGAEALGRLPLALRRRSSFGSRSNRSERSPACRSGRRASLSQARQLED